MVRHVMETVLRFFGLPLSVRGSILVYWIQDVIFGIPCDSRLDLSRSNANCSQGVS